MLNFKVAAILAGTTLAGFAGVACGADLVDEPVQVTTFELKDGKKFEAVAYAALGKDDLRSYVIVEPNGVRSIIFEKEIASQKKQSVAFVDLDEASRREVLRQRSIAAAKKADAEAAATEHRLIADAKLKESAYRAAVLKASDEMSLAKEVLSNALDIVKTAPVDIARADARYDAAKTELAATGGGSYVPPYSRTTTDVHHNEYLRRAMVDAAEDKAKAESAKRDAQEVAARTQEKIKKLEERDASALKAYEAAQAETKQLIEKSEKAAQDRVTAREEKFGNPKPAEKPKLEEAPKK